MRNSHLKEITEGLMKNQENSLSKKKHAMCGAIRKMQ